MEGRQQLDAAREALRRPHEAGHIRLNTELVKKPKDLLEYVVVYEMAHLREPRVVARPSSVPHETSGEG